MKTYKIGQIYLAYSETVRLTRISITAECHNTLSSSFGLHMYNKIMWPYSTRERQLLREVLVENGCT